MNRLARLLLPLVLALAGCTSFATPAAPTPAVAPAAQGPVILISIDGFRADYLDRGITPTLKALADDGVRARAMRPSYPSLTFPNHYTLVTGLRPDHHGITDNTMEDPQIPGVRFSLGNHEATGDRRWWDGAEPLWVTAEKAGIPTATMFWPGSDADIGGVRPGHWLPYDKKMTATERVDQLLAWLDRPAAERPRFLTLYFDRVDTAGHDEGPDSQKVRDAMVETDAAIARLVEGLKARGLWAGANLVIVSDHGMEPVTPERRVFVDDYVPADSFRMVTGGPTAGIVPLPGHEAQVEKALLGKHDHFECWKKAKVPARFHFGTNRRIPPIQCLGETTWLVVTRDSSAKRAPKAGGAHGADPYDPLMAALFIAHGPAFRHGLVIAPFDNVDVYPMLAGLVGVTPRKNDGNPRTLRPILVRR